MPGPCTCCQTPGCGGGCQYGSTLTGAFCANCAPYGSTPLYQWNAGPCPTYPNLGGVQTAYQVASNACQFATNLIPIGAGGCCGFYQYFLLFMDALGDLPYVKLFFVSGVDVLGLGTTSSGPNFAVWNAGYTFSCNCQIQMTNNSIGTLPIGLSTLKTTICVNPTPQIVQYGYGSGGCGWPCAAGFSGEWCVIIPDHTWCADFGVTPGTVKCIRGGLDRGDGFCGWWDGEFESGGVFPTGWAASMTILRVSPLTLFLRLSYYSPLLPEYGAAGAADIFVEYLASVETVGSNPCSSSSYPEDSYELAFNIGEAIGCYGSTEDVLPQISVMPNRNPSPACDCSGAIMAFYGANNCVDCGYGAGCSGGCHYITTNPQVTVFTHDTGTSTFSQPSNGLLKIEIWGGGGGSLLNPSLAPGAGAGGGGYCSITVPYAAGTTIAYSVGAGGTTGTNGGQTTADGTMTANGGQGVTATTPGNGGTATGPAGATTISGSNGVAFSGVTGGNGGDAGNAVGTGGAGGLSGNSGGSGTVPGGGAGGAGFGGHGVAGAGGRVKFTFTMWDWLNDTNSCSASCNVCTTPNTAFYTMYGRPSQSTDTLSVPCA